MVVDDQRAMFSQVHSVQKFYFPKVNKKLIMANKITFTENN